MPQASEEQRARWPGSDGQAIEFLEKRGFIQTADWRWVVPPGHKVTVKESDAVSYLIHEWDWGGFISVEDLALELRESLDRQADVMAEVLRLRKLIGRIVWHAVGKKPEHRAPAGNRLQNIYACVLRALGRVETKKAIEAEPDGCEVIPGPKGGI